MLRRLRQRSSKRFYAVVILIFFFVLAGVYLRSTASVSAVTPGEWRAGHIIDDSVFFNKDSMTVGQIQEFLNAKVPSCNRWHSSSNPSYQPPYTCLKEYQENPSTHANNYGQFNSDGSPATVSGGQSAAQIIWGAAQAYGINPQTLIVMLQKEQGLVTDDWPWSVQYQKAMGYACPDTAPCDSKYYGFFNQVDNAAWQLRQYGLAPQDYLYKAYTTRLINFNPDSSCGGTNVYLENQATADLYNYTPYQPNSEALNAGYAGAPPCGAYGNRNFWLYFNDWFGSTNAGDTQVQLVDNLTITPSSEILANDLIHAKFTLRNNTSTPVYIGGMAVAVRRASDNANFDYALVNITVPPNGTYTYDQVQSLPSAQYSFEIVNYRPGVGWSSSYPYSLYNSLTRKVTGVNVQPPVLLTNGISMSTSALVPGKNFTASFQVTNSTNSPVSLGTMAIAVRDPSGRNLDLVPDNNVIVPANGTYIYSKNGSFPSIGAYSLFITNYRNGIGWNTVTPASSNTSIVRSLAATVKPNPRVITGLSVTPSNPVAGQTTTVSFQIRNDADSPVNIGNMAVAARDPSGRNVDFGLDSNITIPANSTYTYTQSQVFSTVGQYSFTIVNYTSANGWRGFPAYDTNTTPSRNINIGANPTVISGVSLNPTNPIAGQNVTASFQVRNDAEYPVNIGNMAVAARDPSGRNVDFGLDSNVTIQPHTTYTYSQIQTLLTAGNYSFTIVNHQPSTGWSSSYPASSNTSIVRSLTRTIGSNPTVTTSLTLDIASPAVGQGATASFVITNNGDTPMNIGGMAVSVRGPQGQNFDYALVSNISVNPGQTYTYSQKQAFPIAGNYSFTIVNYQPSTGWSSSYPASSNTSIVRSLAATVKPNPRVITGLSVTPSNPVAGQTTTVSFQIRNDADSPVNIGNMAVAARDPSGRNVDFGLDSNITIPANSTYTYTQSQVFSTVGQYSFTIVNYRDGIGWSSTYPTKDSGSVITAKTVTVTN